MKHVSTLLTALVLASLAAFHAAEAAVSPTKPNIVFILADDLGWGDLSCHGHPFIKTPHIDSLAQSGLNFQQFTAANPVCSPSRVAFMTGRQPARFSIHGHFAAGLNQRRGMPDWLDPRVILLPRLLRDAGYRTGHFGKWHLSNNHTVGAPYPDAYGLDEWAVFNGPGDRRKELPQADTGEAVAAFIRANRDHPFYVNAWLHEPHTPHAPSRKAMEKHKGLPVRDQVYAAVVTDADNTVGLILDTLRLSGLESNTLVVFSSDNGPEHTGPESTWWFNAYGDIGLGDWYSVGSTGGLAGRKRELFEGGIRVPLLVRWPGRTPAGSVDDSTVLTAVDFLPTLCAAAGIALPNGFEGDGENLLPALLGQPQRRTTAIFWEWRGSHGGTHGWPALAVREGDLKLLLSEDGKRAALFDLATDRAEVRDLAADRPEDVARLTRLVRDWRDSLPTAPAATAVSPEPRSTDPTAK